MPGKHNGPTRGDIRSRHNRKLWLLNTFGDGTTVECVMKSSPKCVGTLTYETLTVDRYPIPGWRGGSYQRHNIRPACAFCNSSDPQKPWWYT